MQQTKYLAAVIGAGKMGAAPKESGLLSHCAAYNQHPQCELIALCDQSREIAVKAAKYWGVRGYCSLPELMQEVKPDIISISTPDAFHVDQLEQIYAYSPKAIIVEKPVTLYLNDAKKLSKYSRAQHPIITVNYSRRYLPTYYELKAKLSAEEVRGICIRYTKGIIHNGSHAIDLIRLLVGEITSYTVLSSQKDYRTDDPSVSVHFKTNSCDNIILQALDHHDYVYFDVDIFTNTHRYIIHSDHTLLTTYQVKDLRGSPPGKRLVLIHNQSIDHQSSLLNLLNAIVNKLEGHSAVLYSLEEALQTEKIAIEICKRTRQNNTFSEKYESN